MPPTWGGGVLFNSHDPDAVAILMIFLGAISLNGISNSPSSQFASEVSVDSVLGPKDVAGVMKTPENIATSCPGCVLCSKMCEAPMETRFDDKWLGGCANMMTGDE